MLFQKKRTDGYMVTDVRRSGNSAQVTARHEFTDPSGDMQTVYHQYRLQRENVVSNPDLALSLQQQVELLGASVTMAR